MIKEIETVNNKYLYKEYVLSPEGKYILAKDFFKDYFLKLFSILNFNHNFNLIGLCKFNKDIYADITFINDKYNSKYVHEFKLKYIKLRNTLYINNFDNMINIKYDLIRYNKNRLLYIRIKLKPYKLNKKFKNININTNLFVYKPFN